MALPPNSMPEDDPLGGMDPMAWLESLAKRQGANLDELTTSADLNVPVPTGDVKIEGPGYTPGYESAKPDPKPTEPKPPTFKPTETSAAGTAPASAKKPELPRFDPFRTATPPKPVEDRPQAPSLNLRVTPPAPDEDAVEELRYEAVTDDVADVPADDPLGGADPMAWLESLAKRQGANVDELTTSANLDVAVPTGDIKIEGPGYTPGYESAKPAAPIKAEPPPPPPIVPDAVATVVPEIVPPEIVAPAASVAPVADDPLGGADPMAWLESLAKRQGAKTAELTTRADLNVALPTGDYKIDEPGYTPGYELAKPTPPKVELIKKVEAPVEPVPVEPVPVASAPVEPTAVADDPLGGADPMAWLESLAKRQGANVDELTTSANLDVAVPTGDIKIEGPGYTPGYESAKPTPASVAPVEVAPAKIDAVAEPVTAAVDDPLGGADPMAWLESLAKRQGANVDELTTSANLNVAVPTGDIKIEGPGYTPGYESAKPAPAPVEPAKVEPPTPAPEVRPAAKRDTGNFGSTEQTSVEQASSGFDDSFAWLESLSTKTSEVAGIDVPLGEYKYDAEPALDQSEAAALLGLDEANRAPAADPLGGMDPMAWLEGLAAETRIETPNLLGPTYELAPATASPAAGDLDSPESALSWLEGLDDEPVPESTKRFEAVSVDEKGGLSNDPAELQQWLENAASSLIETRERFGDTAPLDAYVEELPVADYDNLPDWLKPAAPSAATVLALSDEVAVPGTPEDLPDWLLEKESDSALGADFIEFGPPADPVKPPALEPIEMTAEEVRALTTAGSAADEDEWASALDEEFSRRTTGDESIPDWYLEAVSRIDEESTAQVAAVQIPAAVGPTVKVEPAEAVDPLAFMPSEEPALPGELPSWLRMPAQEERISPVEIPDWVTEALNKEAAQQSESVEVTEADWLSQLDPTESTKVETPDWLKQMSGIASPVAPVEQSVIAKAEPPPVRKQATAPLRPAASVAKGEGLNKARELIKSDDHSAALEQYQRLIDDAETLEETRADLRLLAESKPKDVKVRRLLGDTHMRLGDLQSALESYRSALDQL